MKPAWMMPLCGALVVLAAMLFLNLDGYHLHLASFPWTSRNPAFKSTTNYRGLGDFTAERPTINWVHGWPIACIIRPGVYPLGAKGKLSPKTIWGGVGEYSRWPFDEAPIEKYNLNALVIDGLLALAGTVGSYLCIARFGRWRKRRNTFSLRSLFLVTASIAVLVAGRESLLTNRYILESAALAAVAIGGSLCVVEACLRLIVYMKHRRR